MTIVSTGKHGMESCGACSRTIALPAISLTGVLLAVAVSGLVPASASASEVSFRNVSFRNEVMAVLSKAGCNQGVCHGNKHGKGGFKLSLRGQSPGLDYEALTRGQSARRTNPLEPDESLILLKPTMRLAHGGGRRFERGTLEYRILRQWIATGLPDDVATAPNVTRLQVSPQKQVLVAPADEVQLEARATFSDGTTRDVTRLAVYETDKEQMVSISPGGLVRRQDFGEVTVIVRFLDRQAPVRLAFVPERPDFTWNGPEPANEVDEYVFAKLKSLRMNPSSVVGDTVFVRRAYLDLLGIPPTAAEARAFVRDESSDKRARLVDRLLERPEFAEFWALKWSDLLRNEEKTLDRKGVQNYYSWIRQSISDGKPLDEFARELIAARGSTYKSPPANYYRAMRDPLTRAETTAQLFLGIRLKCAKCHNHPFDRWTQDDYYGWANFFARVDYKILENRRRDSNDKHEFIGEQIVYMTDEGEVTNPRIGEPTPPRFLGRTQRNFDPQRDRLRQLAEWVTSPRNERFARMQVNRIWYHLMGRGIVDPIDDFRATNPPANPPLLDALAREFVAHDFDLRRMIRRIMHSRTYQLSSVPNETNRFDEANFSHAPVRRLTAEQLLDSLCLVLDTPVKFNGYPRGIRAAEVPGVRAVRPRDKSPSFGDRFLDLFGKPPRLQPCECERTSETTLAQTFEMVSGPMINELLAREDNRIGRLLASEKTGSKIVEEVYWSALSRAPTTQEREIAVKHLRNAGNRRRALEDVTWALLNSGEFLLRR